MNAISTRLEYDGWKLIISFETIIIQKNGEHRVYDIEDIEEVKTEKECPEYVYLTRADGSYYQVKFDVDNFLVIDIFDKDNEFIDSIGSYVFEGIKFG